jgi:hypothetical protein
MNTEISTSESLSVNGSTAVGNEETGASIGGSIGVEVSAEAHLVADDTGISAGAEYKEVLEASATAEGSLQKEGVGVAGSATVYAKTGTDVEGHIITGTHGVDVGAGASIGDAAGLEGEITESARYVSGTAGAGVSVGEHFEAGGSGQAMLEHGVATVGVAGDVAALVGIEVDVSVSIDTNLIVKDSKEVAHLVEKEAPVVINVATKTTNVVVSTAKKTISSINNGAKKMFRKLKI